MADLGLFQAYGMLGAFAVLAIYTGSRASVQAPKAARKALKKSGPASDADDESEEEEEVERLTSSDAYLFPILGSGVLLGLYLVFKYLDKELINKILGGYFAAVGTVGMTRMCIHGIKVFLSRKTMSKFQKWKVVVSKNGKEEATIRFTPLHILFFLLSITLTLAQQLSTYAPQYFGWVKPYSWILSNIFALSFSYNAISLLKLDSFGTGSILLGGLFIYDIWWVFFTPVMVSVATQFEAPIKVVWPKDMEVTSGIRDFTMLGLGDIVIPGIFVSLALRFDYWRALNAARSRSRSPSHSSSSRSPSPLPGPDSSTTDGSRPRRLSFSSSTTPHPSSSYPKPYFRTTFLAYILGLTTTIVVMHTFKAAQPALLYLSPACVGAVTLTGWVRGEWKEVWKWVDGEGEDGEKKDGESEKKGDDENAEGRSTAVANGKGRTPQRK